MVAVGRVVYEMLPKPFADKQSRDLTDVVAEVFPNTRLMTKAWSTENRSQHHRTRIVPLSSLARHDQEAVALVL